MWGAFMGLSNGTKKGVQNRGSKIGGFYVSMGGCIEGPKSDKLVIGKLW